MTTRSLCVAAAIAVLAVAGCSTAPTPSVAVAPSLTVDFPVDCGPIQDVVLCQKAIEVAATAKLNPPPIANVSIRRPRPDDECAKQALHPCGPSAVIVVIQSGDTLQDVPLVRTSDGWVLHVLVR